MNEQIKKLLDQATVDAIDATKDAVDFLDNPVTKQQRQLQLEKFAQLIVRECCFALWTEECHTSDLAFDEVKRNATRIKEHFRIDPKEITEAMLDRSIKWMEQQLADKKHFGVEL
jgi:hypothetical protein